MEKIPAGEARTALMVQMERMISSTFILPDLGDSGLTMACGNILLWSVWNRNTHRLSCVLPNSLSYRKLFWWLPVSAPYLPPVHTDGQQGEYVEGDSHVGDVVVDPAVNGAKDPNSEIKFDIAGERERERPTYLSWIWSLVYSWECSSAGQPGSD